jgi:hypothetical protein
MMEFAPLLTSLSCHESHGSGLLPVIVHFNL